MKNFTDTQLISELQKRHSDDSRYVSLLNQLAVRIQRLAVFSTKGEREALTKDLNSDRENISFDEYFEKLKTIWKGDSVGYHKAFDEYMKWYEKTGCKLNES